MRRPSKRLLLGLATALYAVGQTYTIATYAGGGPFPSSGLASRVPVGSVAAIAADAAGNLYMALPQFHTVLKMNGASGTVTLVAGSGVSGYSGDGGPATSAQLGDCKGIAIDSTGAVYIADESFNVVRKVSGRVITTVAGNGKAGFSGDNGPASSA